MVDIEEIKRNVDRFASDYLKAGFNFREGQREAIISILDNVLNDGNSTHIIEAPTGSGKSLINIISAGVLDKYYGLRSFILASDLTLWDQYAEFIKKNPRLGFGMLKGKDNYKCQANNEPIDSAECKLAGVTMGQLMCENPDRLGFPCARFCTYLRDRKKALKANVTLLTYALYFRTVDSNNMDNQIQCFDARDVVFCDECHNIPNLIQLRYEFGLDRQDISWAAGIYKYAATLTNQLALFDDEGETIEEEYRILQSYFPTEQSIYDEYNKLYDELSDYRKSKDEDYSLIKAVDEFWTRFSPVKELIEESLKMKSKSHIKLTQDEKAILRLCRLLQSYVSGSTIKMLLSIYNKVGHEYIVKSLIDKQNNPDDKIIRLQCAKEDYMTYFGLLSVTPKQVMVSATVGDKDNFDDNIGLKYTQNPESKMEWIESTFNFDKSPIYFLNRYKMSFAEKEKSLEKLKPLIYKVCNNFAGQKGIIQTGTYAIAKDIIDNAPVEIKSRLLYYNGSKEKTEVILKHMMSKDTILIGPTLNEGIDLPGDLCRFIIITKMPYPTIKDRLVDAKMKIFPYWYNSTTSNSIIQGIGRGNRFADDYCTTYIFDACFLKLYTDTQKQYPEYIQRRIKIAN